MIDEATRIGRVAINAVISGSMVTAQTADGQPCVFTWNGNAPEQLGTAILRAMDLEIDSGDAEAMAASVVAAADADDARIAYLEREVERLTAERDVLQEQATMRLLAEAVPEATVPVGRKLWAWTQEQNAALVEALESVAKWLCDGTEVGDCNEKPVHREMLPREEWCYSCVARDALAAAKGEA